MHAQIHTHFVLSMEHENEQAHQYLKAIRKQLNCSEKQEFKIIEL